MRSDAYGPAAQYYDLIYSWKNYRLEAAKLRVLLEGLRGEKGGRLLDVACGTGGHLQFLKKHYETVGIDASVAMVRLARQKQPGTRFLCGDMRSFRLSGRFDAIVCLFSSIAYLRSERELARAMKNFARHLAPGGIVVIEPYLEPRSFDPGALSDVMIVKRPGLNLVRLTGGHRRGNRAVFDFHLLVSRDAKRGQIVEHFADRHELTLFTHSAYLRAMKQAGFSACLLKEGLTDKRGLFVGRLG